jgi:CO/xanthine dehydrogenase FAD-binding subunit
LVAQGYATIAGAEGTRRERLRELFNKRLKLKNGEFLVDLRVPRSVTTLHSYYARRTKDARVDYPLLSLTMLRDEAGIRAAFAGTASYPVADDGADDLLSGSGSPASRADQVAARIEKSIRSDMRGGAKYRRFLLTDALEAGIAHLSSTS